MRLLQCALLLAAASHVSASEFALQTLGEFHGDEIIAQQGEPWLALHLHAGQAWLTPVLAQVDAVNDPVLDAPDGLSGRAVTAPGIDGEVIALLRGAGLTPGKIEGGHTVSATLQPDRSMTLELDGLAPLTLAIACPQPRPALGTQFACVVQADDQQVRQELHTFDASVHADQIMLGDDGGVQLRFAGDLDRDGRVDLLLDLSDHYNVQVPTLFLSRGAGDGTILRIEAMQRITGC